MFQYLEHFDKNNKYVYLPNRSFIKTGSAAKASPNWCLCTKRPAFKAWPRNLHNTHYTYVCWIISSKYPMDPMMTSWLCRSIKGQSREIRPRSIIFYARAQTNSKDPTEYFSNKKFASRHRKYKRQNYCVSWQTATYFFRTHCPFLAELLIYISFLKDYSIQFSA